MSVALGVTAQTSSMPNLHSWRVWFCPSQSLSAPPSRLSSIPLPCVCLCSELCSCVCSEMSSCGNQTSFVSVGGSSREEKLAIRSGLSYLQCPGGWSAGPAPPAWCHRLPAGQTQSSRISSLQRAEEGRFLRSWTSAAEQTVFVCRCEALSFYPPVLIR